VVVVVCRGEAYVVWVVVVVCVCGRAEFKWGGKRHTDKVQKPGIQCRLAESDRRGM